MNYLKRKNLFILFLIGFIIYQYIRIKNFQFQFGNLNGFLVQKKKFMIYECSSQCGGWGDRIRGIISSYAWSLISDRVFVINIPYPCDIQNLVVPNKVLWNRTIVDLINYEGLPKNFSSFVFDFENKLSALGSFHELDLPNFKNDTDVIFVRINYEINDIFNKNQFIKSKLEELNYDLKTFKYENYIADWFNKLFKLNPLLETKYQDYLKQAKENPEDKLICAQIRIGGPRPLVKDDLYFIPRNNTFKFWSHINKTFIPRVAANATYKIFVTTDTEAIEDEAKNLYGNKLFQTKGLFVHFDRDGMHQDCSRFEKVVLDFFLFKNCDMTIISRKSSYGRYANFIRDNYTKNYLHIS